MTGFFWIFGIVIIALSLAALALQGWTTRLGEARTAYFIAIVVLAVGGGVLGWGVVPSTPEAALVPGMGAAAPTHPAPYIVFGAACGLGAVALGPHILDAGAYLLKVVSRALGRRAGGDK
jgi:hypothetical protein